MTVVTVHRNARPISEIDPEITLISDTFDELQLEQKVALSTRDYDPLYKLYWAGVLENWHNLTLF